MMTRNEYGMAIVEILKECDLELTEKLGGKYDEDIIDTVRELISESNKVIVCKLYDKLFKTERHFDAVRTTATKPERSTSAAACYDFISPISITIPAGSTVSIPTGIKAKFPKNEALMLYSRSGMGFKHNIVLTNGTAIIDSDYYGNKTNDGEIIVGLRNMGKESYTVKSGDKIAQGMFVKFGLTDDDRASATREGGLGSTGK